MATILLNSSLEDEYQKQLHSLKLKRFYQQRNVASKTRTLAIVSLILIIVAVYHGWYVMYFAMIVFLWVIFGLSNVMDAFIIDRSERRLRKAVEGYFDPSIRATLTFDDGGYSLTVNKPKEETFTLAWDHFIGYNLSGDVLLLAAMNNNGLCFTRQEMGDSAFDEFTQLAAAKLPTLISYFENEKPWWQFLVTKA